MAPELTSQFIEFKEVLELSKLHDVHHHPAPIFKYYGFKPGTVTLEKGHQRFEGVRPLPCDLVWERDTAVNMRDGVKIYTDVFRLPEAGKVPTIIHWGPYGKVSIMTSAYTL